MIIMTEEEPTINSKFHIPWGRDSCAWVWHISYIEKIHDFFKKILLQALIRQTEGKVIMSTERSTNIVNFMTPRAGILVLGHGQTSHIVNMNYFLSYSLHAGLYQTNSEYSNDDQKRVYPNCKFHDPRVLCWGMVV